MREPVRSSRCCEHVCSCQSISLNTLLWPQFDAARHCCTLGHHYKVKSEGRPALYPPGRALHTRQIFEVEQKPVTIFLTKQAPACRSVAVNVLVPIAWAAQ